MLKYSGGKSRELDIINPKNFDLFSTPHIPKFKRFVEPFVGGGSLFFDLAPNPAIINDVNSKLINFYRDVRDNYDLMIAQLTQIKEIYDTNTKTIQDLLNDDPNSTYIHPNQTLFYDLRTQFNAPTGKWLEGTIYYFINKTVFSGAMRFNDKGELNQSFSFYPSFNISITKEHSTLLQNTEIYNDDYAKIFDLLQADDFVFLDPPYDCVFYQYGNIKTLDASNEEFQRRLASDYKNLNCPALMVISKTPLIQELYAPYIKQTYDKKYSVNFKNHNKTPIVEHVIIKNY